ncbi:beta-N-acetylglucosaminidase domain-containing protein [Chitinivibrio alkaliphilus]|uniref:Beta-N-acetylglucosaminidase n=1 Tax=Chitinivibrio alkaliphilus ACht1 TaxID=1313304 RepID=U7D6A9_9BACT|nr:beta-N-acetylglucosaminidase domain-containing protein [Chitinivibrio alkaliphilus]ERP31473.1 Beta-N-acetylglucosaminidase [Chitinivibrio alkaliphilus ACht1]
MKVIGYIEGYYGRLLSHTERGDLIDHLAKEGYTAYVYAPKEDPFHRLNWTATPPREYRAAMGETMRRGAQQGVQVIPAIAPGLSLQYNSPSQRDILRRRVAEFCEDGARTIALLFDDISLSLREEEYERYGNAAQAQLEILHELRIAFPTIPFLFCPTIYTTQLLKGEEAHEYIRILSSELPSGVTLLWTGEHTITPAITNESLHYPIHHFGTDLLIWDNYYCNDYTPNRLFIGPYTHRDRTCITETTAGVLINGTGLFHTDCFLLSVAAKYLFGTESPWDAWQSCANRWGLPEAITKILPWIQGPYDSPPQGTLHHLYPTPEALFMELLVHWQSPVKLEWYPYIHRLFTELKLETGQGIENKEWFTPRFYPEVRELLKKRFYPPSSSSS